MTELMVVMVLLAAVAGLAIPNFQVLTRRSHNVAAATDYRHLKLAVLNALADPTSPDQFVLSHVVGPLTLGAPLRGATISSDVEISVFHQTVQQSGTAPLTVTSISVQSLKGDQLFQYDELNGVVLEQVIDLN